VKIAVVGCGAVGSFYGARLCRAGQEVYFLLRSDYDVVKQHGVQIESGEGDYRVRPFCAKHPEEIGPAELVLIALKSTANYRLQELVTPLVGQNTTLLTLQNGLGNEKQLAQYFPTAQVMGGLCFVCLNRTAPGVVAHLAFGRVVLGEFGSIVRKSASDLARDFNKAGIECRVASSLALAQWEKLVWNIPFNGLGVAGAAGDWIFRRLNGQAGTLPSPGPCLSTDRLLKDTAWSGLVKELMLEVIAAACALGHELPQDLADRFIERTRAMGSYKASTLLDFERGQPLELESLFVEPLRQAQQAGVKMPRLAALCELLGRVNPAS